MASHGQRELGVREGHAARGPAPVCRSCAPPLPLVFLAKGRPVHGIVLASHTYSRPEQYHRTSSYNVRGCALATPSASSAARSAQRVLTCAADSQTEDAQPETTTRRTRTRSGAAHRSDRRTRVTEHGGRERSRRRRGRQSEDGLLDCDRARPWSHIANGHAGLGEFVQTWILPKLRGSLINQSGQAFV